MTAGYEVAVCALCAAAAPGVGGGGAGGGGGQAVVPAQGRTPAQPRRRQGEEEPGPDRHQRQARLRHAVS